MGGWKERGVFRVLGEVEVHFGGRGEGVGWYGGGGRGLGMMGSVG